jgi:excinuclease ABC subunit B
LLGVTGSGKTFSVANVVQKTQRSALVIAHNKTLAGQLYSEFKQFFPNNAVAFFVSYYDYYQPEAYVPQSDTYIEKDSAINDEIDRMRHVATHSLLTNRHVIIVASVSCIFGLGPVENYGEMRVSIATGDNPGRDRLLRRLVEIQYSRNDLDFHRGTFRVRGDVVDVFPVYEEDRALRLSYFGDELESIHWFDPLRGKRLSQVDAIDVYPGSHFATPAESLRRAKGSILEELRQRLTTLKKEQKLVEAQRLEQRTLYDLEMIDQIGYCKGIENYSRHLSGRLPGEPPPTLIDYLPHDALVVIDESHQTLPQIKAMIRGDRSRKQTLVDYGFRMPSALDNRPLSYAEFDVRVGQRIYVSATPADFEVEQTKGVVVEQIIRPTGLVDPALEIRPAKNQVDDLLAEIKDCAKRGLRIMVTTLTKRMAEDLTDFLSENSVRVRYMHSDIKTLERLDIIREFRANNFDVLVGINLLREGLDIPEVGLVAVLDADREGFLRSETSLIQTIGRAARNAEGRAILYADKITNSIQKAVDETERRRDLQSAHNQQHGITPATIKKAVVDVYQKASDDLQATPNMPSHEGMDEMERIDELESRMLAAAKELDFEQAAELRDEVRAIKQKLLLQG